MNDRVMTLLDRLADALQELYDWQNGPPLLSEKWENGWGGAMKMSKEALDDYYRMKQTEIGH